MITLVYKIVFFLWNMLAPEQAKAGMQKAVKDFVNVMMLLMVLSFVFGAGCFAGTYFLGQWLARHIEQTFICYFIAGVVALFFTFLTAGIVFRYLVSGFFERLHDKGNEILTAFSPHKKV